MINGYDLIIALYNVNMEFNTDFEWISNLLDLTRLSYWYILEMFYYWVYNVNMCIYIYGIYSYIRCNDI